MDSVESAFKKKSIEHLILTSSPEYKYTFLLKKKKKADLNRVLCHLKCFPSTVQYLMNSFYSYSDIYDCICAMAFHWVELQFPLEISGIQSGDGQTIAITSLKADLYDLM